MQHTNSYTNSSSSIVAKSCPRPAVAAPFEIETLSPSITSFPITPPSTDSDLTPKAEDILAKATHVLSTEATALSCLSRLYSTDPLCRESFLRAVDAIVRTLQTPGKVVVSGVGKSGKIGAKFVATMISLGLKTVSLNPVEALHGDLGIIDSNDILVLITFSGKTPELLNLMPHLPAHMPVIVLTSHTNPHTLPLISNRVNSILLPTPIPESETTSFGISAPTTSTTVTMALLDAVALTAADLFHEGIPGGPKEVFKQNHPGGAIGVANRIGLSPSSSPAAPPRLRSLAVSWTDIPIVEDLLKSTIGLGAGIPPSPAMSVTSTESDIELSDDYDMCIRLRVLDCLRLGISSPKGWLRTSDGGIISPRKLQGCMDIMAEVYSPDLGLVLDVNDAVKMNAELSVREAAMDLGSRIARGEVAEDSPVVVVLNGNIMGVVEVGDVVKAGAGLV
ncbi:hypothetical protein BZA77DRAFT_248135 [Pyronema omphalodes]|nr:hypothetical protein BZA77DRAFT_248135 [Pyronema omphalodes]